MEEIQYIVTDTILTGKTSFNVYTEVILFKESGKWYSTNKIKLDIDQDYFKYIEDNLVKKNRYINNLLDIEFSKEVYKNYIVVVPLKEIDYLYPLIYDRRLK